MDRRELLVATGSVCGVLGVAGCLDGDETGEQNIGRNEGADDASSSTDDSGSTGAERTASDSTDNSNGAEESEEEVCHTEVETQNEEVVDRSRSIEGGYEWTHEYRCDDDDTVHFDVAASSGQDVAVEIDSPQGRTVYSETGLSLTTTHRFDNGGYGEVRVANLGERTNEEREELWEDREEIPAGNGLAPWVELNEDDSVDYRIRMVDGARPKLRIEDSSGRTLREHSVAEVIDDTFTAPEDGRYYFYVENTAVMTSGLWDYTFERVTEVPISTTVELTIEREYEEEVEICN